MEAADKDALDKIRKVLKGGLAASLTKKKPGAVEVTVEKDESADGSKGGGGLIAAKDEGSPEEEAAETPEEEAAEVTDDGDEESKTPGLKEAMAAVSRYLPKKKGK